MELLSFVETAVVFVVSVYHRRCVVLLNRKSLGRVDVEDLRFVWKFKKCPRIHSPQLKAPCLVLAQKPFYNIYLSCITCKSVFLFLRIFGDMMSVFV